MVSPPLSPQSALGFFILAAPRENSMLHAGPALGPCGHPGGTAITELFTRFTPFLLECVLVY